MIVGVTWGAAEYFAMDTLCVIESDYRPSYYQVARSGYDNQNGEIVINTDGTVVYQANNGSAWYGRGSFCYIAAS